jgi:hypothetical protein
MKSLATLAVFLLISSAPALAQRGGSSVSGRSAGGAGHYSGGGGGGHYGGGGGHYGGGGSYYHGGGYGGYGNGHYGYRSAPYYSYPYYSYIPSFGFGYGSVYPGSVSDYGYGYSGGYAEPAPPPDYYTNYAPPSQQQPPVIINQTFVNGMPAGSAQAQAYDQGGQPADPTVEGETHTYQSPAPTPQEWAMSEGHYYLIAYKDHSVYTALAYWMEGGALHYVTPQNIHNQVSLDLLDLELTRKLNAGRGLSFNLQSQR